MLASRSHACILAGLVVASLASVATIAPAEIGDLLADGVIGQSTFTDATALPIGPTGFGTPKGVAIDRSVQPNRVYVSDSVYHRVLGWADVDELANGAPADLVIGQPDAFSWGCNHDVVSAGVPAAPTLSSLCSPAGLAVDPSGNLYVADSGNCRVLVFRDPFNTDGVADAVLGQSAPGYQGCGVAQDKLYDPMGVATDAAGNAFVADTLNCRVLEYDRPLDTDTLPDRVYGQTSFTAHDCGATNLYFPAGVSVDANERLYVSSPLYVLYEFDDALNDHVVDRTFGTGQCNPNGESSSSTCGILSGATDDAGRLYVADSGNDRVLEFDDPLTVSQASRVFGQASFTGTSDLFHDACNLGGPSASSLCLRKVRLLTLGGTYDEAGALALDDNGRLWVADGLNNRVLRYDTPLESAAANLVLGQSSMSDIRQPVFAVETPQAIIDQSYVLVLEPDASRLLVYYNYSYARATPIAVLGQPDFETTGCNATGLSGGSLCAPRGLSLDAYGNLWIADTGNNRVLEFASPWLTYDSTAQRYVMKATADAIFGQADATSTACAAGASGLCAPGGVASDPARSLLYVADTGNNRVVRHENPLADAIADSVIGQADFEGTTCDAGGLGASSLCQPQGLALDPADGALYVADAGNDRVLLYARGSMTAELVLGQPDMGSGSPSAGAGGLSSPVAVALDRRGNVYVADRDNNRVLEYDAPRSGDTQADRVFGQPDFTSVACSVSDHGLCQPVGVSEQYYYDDTLVVADAGNNRVLIFDSPFCIDDYRLTAANRRLKTPHSTPVKTKLKVFPGLGAPGETLMFDGANVLLEQDGGISPGESPLLTLSGPSGVLYQERVPDLSNVNVGPNSETWSTVYLKGQRDSGIDDYIIKERFSYPSNKPSYGKYTYKGRSVGLDLHGFPASAQWRIQWGATCFTTDLTCTTGMCKPAK
ncbi:MAG: NHL repeat-containing protein [Deltaproteobacteria bacterium]|nr:NHL repeat-containing protein [Deltaproteobacteria bacterium]